MKQNDDTKYWQLHRKRIIWFAWITLIYLVGFLAYTVAGFFIELDWSFTLPLIVYCLYSIWFNAYNYYCFRQNSIASEQHRNTLHLDIEKELEIEIKKDFPDYAPFNFKKSRQSVLMFSLLAILMNVLLIILNGGEYWWL